MPPCEELRVHIESLDKKGAIDQPPVPEKYMSRPEGNPKKDEDPRKDPSTQMCSRSRQKSFLPDTRCPDIQRRMKKIPGRIKIPRRIQAPQMCARNRQKSFLPEKNLQAEMSRSLSRTHVDRVTITKLFRRRLSADKCRGTPMWIGQSSQVFRGHFVRDVGKQISSKEADVEKIMGSLQEFGSPIPGASVSSLPPQLLRDEDLYRGRHPSSGSSARRKLTTQTRMFVTSAIKPTDQDPSKARKPPMMPQRSSMTNLFIVFNFVYF